MEHPGTDYKTDYNNFIDTNATEIGNVMSLYENDIQDYHRKTDFLVDLVLIEDVQILLGF